MVATPSPQTPITGTATVTLQDDEVGTCTYRDFPLHHGTTLPEVQIHYELFGNPNGPLVVVLGGISASAHSAPHSANQEPGWWASLVGDGLGVDTRDYRILGFDYLGGNGRSSGPRNHETFPTISTFDQATCLKVLLDDLGLNRCHAILGASYGGMVGLAFAARYPTSLDRLVVVSAGADTPPMATAWRTLQRNIIRLGINNGATDDAVCLSRALAMTTYRSPQEFAQRFDGPPNHDGERYTFPVEDYLTARGKAFAQSFHPAAFLCLSESIDLHKVNPQQVQTPCTLISVRSDLLVPPETMARLHSELGGPGELIEIDSLYGHDAFLKETDALTPHIRKAIL